MSSSAAVVLLVCVVVCFEGKWASGFENIKDEKQLGEENSVLSQVLEELRRLTDEDKKNKEEMNNIKDEISKLKGQLTSSKAAVHDSSAFMAVMDGGYQYPDIEDVILFNHVLLNMGQNYDDTTSIFTCAERGLYLFSVTLYSSYIRYLTPYDRVTGALMVDGVNVAEIMSATHDPDHDQFQQSSVTAVVECPKGGRVWVQCQWDKNQVYGTDIYPRSIFTGYAIKYFRRP